ncbi:MAG TPA: hypothetical protein VFU93_12705 [Acidimicrobiales bacterium]|nr:hypothetical protein [Acidimicrobiales bacterium]
MTTSSPPVPGMPLEMWRWLREARPVRPDVVARAKAALAAGDRPVTADEIALAMLEGPYRDVA